MTTVTAKYLTEITLDLVAGTITGTIVPETPVRDPMVIYADQWTAIHDVEHGVGHRKVEVSPDVVVPENHVIKLYSWSAPNEPVTKGNATITPGVAYTTNTPLPEGSTCYTSLWWFSNNVATKASENDVVFTISK